MKISPISDANYREVGAYHGEMFGGIGSGFSSYPFEQFESRYEGREFQLGLKKVYILHSTENHHNKNILFILYSKRNPPKASEVQACVDYYVSVFNNVPFKFVVSTMISPIIVEELEKVGFVPTTSCRKFFLRKDVRTFSYTANIAEKRSEISTLAQNMNWQLKAIKDLTETETASVVDLPFPNPLPILPPMKEGSHHSRLHNDEYIEEASVYICSDNSLVAIAEAVFDGRGKRILRFDLATHRFTCFEEAEAFMSLFLTGATIKLHCDHLDEIQFVLSTQNEYAFQIANSIAFASRDHTLLSKSTIK